MSDITVTLLILVGAVVLFVWNKVPAGIVALLVALSLWATGILTVEQAVAGFGSPTVVLIAALFVVAEGLDAAGLTTLAGQQLIARAGDDKGRLLLFTMLLAAILSALITPNGAAAALIPMVVVLAVRLGTAPSRLLMPLAFAAHAGSLLMLTGTPINVLVSEAATSVGERDLRFFEFAWVGIPLTIGTMAITLLLGPRLLPERKAENLPPDLSRLPEELQGQYLPEGVVARLRIPANAPGKTLADLEALAPHPEVRLLAVLDAAGQPLAKDGDGVPPGGILVVRGPEPTIGRLAADLGLELDTGTAGTELAPGLVGTDHGIAEVLVPPRSAYVGDHVFPGMTTASGELVVLAVLRDGEAVEEETHLLPGDSLLLQGTWDALDRQTRDPQVVLVDAPDAIRRQASPLGRRTVPAVAVLAAMIVLLATGAVPAVVAGLAAAIAMVLLKVVTVEQAHRSMSWTTLILVAGMIPLSTAITQTGAADLIAGGMIGVVGGLGPRGLLLGLFLIAAVLGQLISNTATALILIPLAVSIARETGVSPLPLLMGVNVASAAALLTPVATPANLMVQGPAGYKFTDYPRLGLPLMLLYLLVTLFVVPLVWPW